MLDSAKWKAYSKPDEELQALLPHLPPMKPFADYKDAVELRESINVMVGQLVSAGMVTLPDWTGYNKREIQIPTRDGASLRSLVMGPKDGCAPGPLFIFFHGGGWTFGEPEFGEPMMEIAVKHFSMTCVSVGYRVGPENPFPAAHHDAVDAVHWCTSNPTALSADPRQGIVLSGTSAGANLALSAAHEAFESNLSPPVTGVAVTSPNVCHHLAGSAEYEKHNVSWEDNRESMILGRRDLEWFYGNYKPDPKSPLFSPLVAETHKGQPPTYLQIMGGDPLRDEALIYEHMLQEAGVPVRTDVYPGIPHGAPDFLPMHSCAKKSLEDLKAGLAWIVGHQKEKK